MDPGGDLELPQPLQAVLPKDPYEQLDVARKITSMAISFRVSKLEGETGKLRQKLSEKENTIYDLQQHIVELEQSLQETTAQLSNALDEQANLTKENNALNATVKKLNRDVSKLEVFKRTLMQSLQEEDDVNSQKNDNEKIVRQSSLGSSSAVLSLKKVDEGRSSVSSKPYHTSQFRSLNPASDPITASSAQEADHNLSADVNLGGQKPVSVTPHQLTPQLTPTGSPKRQSAAGTPLQLSAPGSPRFHNLSDSRLSLPSSLSTSQHTTAPSSPPQAVPVAARTPRVDGKEFFRQARTRLSYEQFSAFLTNIKELNAHRQTREETLRNADGIFGPDNKDLYSSFDGLLSRHLPI